MPHFDQHGNQEIVCQKGAHVFVGHSTWVDRESILGKVLNCHGNVCDKCLAKAGQDERPACKGCGAKVRWLGASKLCTPCQNSADTRNIGIEGAL